MARVAVFGVAVLLVAAGCGGGGSRLYDAAGTRACLVAHSARVVAATDAIATEAPASFDSTVSGATVTLAFHRTSADAERALRGYQMIGTAFGVATGDLLARYGNVTAAWNHSPTPGEQRTVADCLSSAS